MTPQDSLKERERYQKHAHLSTQAQAKAGTNTNSNADQDLNAHWARILDLIFARKFGIMVGKLNNKARKDEL